MEYLFIIVLGVSWESGTDSENEDPTGISLHNVQWASLVFGAHGGGFSWWWDSFIFICFFIINFLFLLLFCYFIFIIIFDGAEMWILRTCTTASLELHNFCKVKLLTHISIFRPNNSDNNNDDNNIIEKNS